MPPVVESVHVDHLIERIDVNDVVSRIDLDAMIDAVDLDRGIARVEGRKVLTQVGWMHRAVDRPVLSRSGSEPFAAAAKVKGRVTMTDYDVAPGWYLDPSGQGEARYWNGASWTATVNRQGTTFNAAIEPAHAGVPPIPGTEVHLPIPVSTEYTLAPSPKRSPVVAVVGLLVALFVVILIVVMLSNDNSSDDTPPAPATTAPPAEEAPAETG